MLPLDGVATLDRLAALPVYQWAAKDDPRRIPHAGPTAQDFMAAFGLGDNDKLVGYSAIARAAQRLPEVELVRFGKEAHHEILREADPVRGRALAAADAFLARIAGK